MRIQSLNPQPVLEVHCLNAGKGPGTFTRERIPILTGVVSGLPPEIDGLVVTGDLQVREPFRTATPPAPPRLLGEVVPDQLADDWLPALGLPRADRMGVVLAGDFWCEPALDARGGLGDVSSVWRAFGSRFAWVAGVAGNHDAFGPSPSDRPRFGRTLHFLDGDRRRIGRLSVAGVSGIIGNPAKPWRRTPDDYLEYLDDVLGEGLDLLVLHDGPEGPTREFRGSPLIRQWIELTPPRLVIRGHAHWHEPLVELSGGTQVLNVDARVVILTAAGSESSPVTP